MPRRSGQISRAAPIKNIDQDLQPRAAQGDIDGRSVKGEIAQRNLAKEVRQHGPLESDVRPVEIETEPETGLEHEERRDRRPGLRHAGDRIEDRTLCAAVHEAAEQFGQSPQVGHRRGRRDRAGAAARIARLRIRPQHLPLPGPQRFPPFLCLGRGRVEYLAAIVV
jgi:hypothetical protein